MKTINFIKEEEEEEDSYPASPSSSEWESSSEEHEGGSPEKMKISPVKKTKTSMKKTKHKKSTKNQIILDKAHKIKGEYPKIKTKGALIREQKEKHSEYENFYKACDLYLGENNVLFNYQSYDESMQPDEPDQLNVAVYENEDVEGMRCDEYNPPDKDEYNPYISIAKYLNYSKLPDYEGLKYIPPLFREKYELCIWKLDTHN